MFKSSCNGVRSRQNCISSAVLWALSTAVKPNAAMLRAVGELVLAATPTHAISESHDRLSLYSAQNAVGIRQDGISLVHGRRMSPQRDISLLPHFSQHGTNTNARDPSVCYPVKYE